MPLNWQHRKQEESYLGQLEQILVNRLRQTEEDRDLKSSAALIRGENLSEFSRDINEELGRIEQLVEEFDK